jgi:DNA-binding transcriptional LysR family regulator
MDETTFEWSDLRLFLAAARGGGLARGAALSGTSAPTLGRRMLALEAALGERFFDRLPRGYRLTAAGRALVADAEAIEERARWIAQRFRSRDAELPVCISTDPWTSRFLAARIDRLCGGPRLVLMSSDHWHDIARREATIALRDRLPVEPGLVAKRIGAMGFASYARPSAPRRWIVLPHESRAPEDASLADAALQATSPPDVVEMVRSGAGMATLPVFVGDGDPLLERVSDPKTTSKKPVFLIVHPKERERASVRSVMTKLASVFAADRDILVGR